jgi:hypothetical protein
MIRSLNGNLFYHIYFSLDHLYYSDEALSFAKFPVYMQQFTTAHPKNTVTTQGEQGSRSVDLREKDSKVWTAINCYNEENKLQIEEGKESNASYTGDWPGTSVSEALSEVGPGPWEIRATAQNNTGKNRE